MAVNIDQIASPNERRRLLAASPGDGTAHRALLQQDTDMLQLDGISIVTFNGEAFTQTDYKQFVAAPPLTVVLTNFDPTQQDSTAAFTITGSGTASGCFNAGFSNSVNCAGDSTVYNFQLDFLGMQDEDYEINLGFWEGSDAQTRYTITYATFTPPFNITVAGAKPGGRRLLQVILHPRPLASAHAPPGIDCSGHPLRLRGLHREQLQTCHSADVLCRHKSYESVAMVHSQSSSEATAPVGATGATVTISTNNQTIVGDPVNGTLVSNQTTAGQVINSTTQVGCSPCRTLLCTMCKYAH